MADNEGGEETSSRGNDWEVISLTASAYAAAPGPKVFDPPAESKEESNNADSAAKILTESDCSEIQNELASQDLKSEDDHCTIKAYDDNWKLKSDDGLHGIHFFEKGKNLSDHGVELGEGKMLDDLTVVGKEPDMHIDPSFSAFHAETVIHQSVLCNDESYNAESNVCYDNPEEPLDNTKATNLNQENKADGHGLPCEAWWKRHAMSVYYHAKEANTFWSVLVAAAVMGFIILGKKWHRQIAAPAT